MRTILLKSAAFILVLCFLHKSAGASETDGSALLIDQVQSLVQQRLELMPAVARYKWDRNLPVEDLAREAQILNRTVHRAKNMGMDPIYAQQAVTAQMMAAKMIQSRLFQTWRADNASFDSTQPQDLVKDIRPKISNLTHQLIGMHIQLRALTVTCHDINTLRAAPTSNLFTAQEWHVAVRDIAPTDLSCGN